MFKAMEKLRKGEQVLIVCIGDSITEQNFHLHGHLNYVGRLGEKLIDTFGRKLFVFNAGVSGDTTWGGLDRLERDVLRWKPDLVTVMFGMNDCIRGTDQIPQFRSNLAAIAEAIAHNGGETLLLTQNMLKFEILDNAAQRGSYPDYVEAIREVAAARQIPLCDIYRKWEETSREMNYKHWMMMDDEIHPNEHGHLFMARALFDYLGVPE